MATPDPPKVLPNSNDSRFSLSNLLINCKLDERTLPFFANLSNNYTGLAYGPHVKGAMKHMFILFRSELNADFLWRQMISDGETKNKSHTHIFLTHPSGTESSCPSAVHCRPVDVIPIFMFLRPFINKTMCTRFHQAVASNGTETPVPHLPNIQ